MWNYYYNQMGLIENNILSDAELHLKFVAT